MALLTRILAATALLLVLFWLFRLAMGLRYAKLKREQERLAEEARGRRVVAEVPTPAGDLVLFLEDVAGFRWGSQDLSKSELDGVRLLVNGRVIDSRQRPGVALPAAGWEEAQEGRERWDVLLHLGGGRVLQIPCGSLREGVSREAAQRVFAAVARAIA